MLNRSLCAPADRIFVTPGTQEGAHPSVYLLPGRSSATEPDDFAARLRTVVDGHGGASALARVIARSEGAVRKWLRAESEPNVSDLRAICAATATNVGWLVSGSAERAPAPSPTRAPEARAPDAKENYALLESLLERVEAEIARAHLSVNASKRASLVATLYQLSREHKTLDPEAFARLVKLAQP
jgi:DNA-binding phage protein